MALKIETLFFASLIILAAFDSSGQSSVEEPIKHFSKITIDEGDVFLFESDTLLVDTLIIRDRGKLTFLNDHTVVGIVHAVIGNHCKFDASGLSGNNGDQYSRDGAAGAKGKDLVISIRFEELGSLVVIGSGGDGGTGFAAPYVGEMPPANAINGGNGGSGGNGGAAGNLDFFYLSPHFVVVFNEERNHSVQFEVGGGRGGSGGKGAEGWTVRTLVPGNRYEYSKVPKGNNGIKGFDGKTGKFRFMKTDPNH